MYISYKNILTKTLISLLFISFIFLLSLNRCQSSEISNDNDIIFQTSTINALLEKVFKGNLSFKELKTHGDFGIGTFNDLDGEMIALDNKFYQIKADGKVYSVKDSQFTPFSVVTFFESDSVINTKEKLNYSDLKQYLDNRLPTQNIFYAIKIDGTFKYVKTRSVPKQKKPYPGIAAIIKNQPIFEFENIKGTMVGFRLPKYMHGINVPGYHLHFITSDKTAGGHVLDCQLLNVKIDIDYTSKSYMMLPELDDFYSADLSKEKPIDINKVEK